MQNSRSAKGQPLNSSINFIRPIIRHYPLHLKNICVFLGFDRHDQTQALNHAAKPSTAQVLLDGSSVGRVPVELFYLWCTDIGEGAFCPPLASSSAFVLMIKLGLGRI